MGLRLCNGIRLQPPGTIPLAPLLLRDACKARVRPLWRWRRRRGVRGEGCTGLLADKDLCGASGQVRGVPRARASALARRGRTLPACLAAVCGSRVCRRESKPNEGRRCPDLCGQACILAAWSSMCERLGVRGVQRKQHTHMRGRRTPAWIMRKARNKSVNEQQIFGHIHTFSVPVH